LTSLTSTARSQSNPVRLTRSPAGRSLGWQAQMSPALPYLYELRRGEEVIATGHLTHDEPPELGGRITIAGREGIVRSIIPIRGQIEQRLILQLLPAPDDP
jgi:hypothetical protein